MKPSLGLDEQTLRQKNLKHYLHRMKKNKYWKMGYDAAKKKKGKFIRKIELIMILYLNYHSL